MSDKKKQLVIPNNLISRPFTGDTCDEAENLCIAQNPCEEDNTEDCLSATANSLDLFNDFNCVCKVGFTGRHCEVLTCFENYLEFMSKCRKSKILKYQGVKEFHMLARIGCNCKIMIFSPSITYYCSSKGNK